ncbi:hypothetical protein AC792_14500 [Arthrobacter sp. RIT-PI-e]|nr:hypothetical protein AC792_14500 [Arthrobacter sp. RIT-PI-e]
MVDGVVDGAAGVEDGAAVEGDAVGGAGVEDGDAVTEEDAEASGSGEPTAVVEQPARTTLAALRAMSVGRLRTDGVPRGEGVGRRGIPDTILRRSVPLTWTLPVNGCAG